MRSRWRRLVVRCEDWSDRFADRHARGLRFARRYGPIALLACVLLLVWFGSYNNRRDNRESQLQSCVRSLFGGTDSIRSDQRQHDFFHAAAIARRATGPEKVNQDAADTYERLAKEAQASAVRRAGRLLGSDVKVLSQLTEKGRPTPAAIAEAKRACENTVPPAGIF